MMVPCGEHGCLTPGTDLCSHLALLPPSFQAVTAVPPRIFHNHLEMVQAGLQTSGQAGLWDSGTTLNSTLPCFCQERLDKVILEVPSNLVFHDSIGWVGLVLLKPLSSSQMQSEMVTVLLILRIRARSSGRTVPL